VESFSDKTWIDMVTKKLSLDHLVQFPASQQDSDASFRYPTILTLHGRGSNERDLIELAAYLPTGLLWISPRAPLLLGPDSYEWYRVRQIGNPEPDQVMTALDTIEHFIEEIFSAYPVHPEKLFLLGFSQGSILSMCYTLSHPSRIAGVIAQSGYIPKGMNLEIDEEEIKSKPFLLTHGKQDTLIPIEWGRLTRDMLQSLGVDLTYHEFQMGHQVSMESLVIISAWLEKQLET
jgi:phospholipase/carboxylesterase